MSDLRETLATKFRVIDTSERKPDVRDEDNSTKVGSKPPTKYQEEENFAVFHTLARVGVSNKSAGTYKYADGWDDERAFDDCASERMRGEDRPKWFKLFRDKRRRLFGRLPEEMEDRHVRAEAGMVPKLRRRVDDLEARVAEIEGLLEDITRPKAAE